MKQPQTKYEFIQTEEKYSGQVGEIRLGPPPANVLTAKVISEISRRITEEQEHPNRKLIIIRGQGNHFSYGASVEEHLPSQVGEMLPAFHRMIGQVIDSSVPILARVSGLCLGGGLELALSCSFIYADDTAKFAVPEIQLGVFPPVAAALLPFQSGGISACNMILGSDKFSARDLYQAGLVTAFDNPVTLEVALASFIEKQILPKSASSLRIAHKASRLAMSEHYWRMIGRLEKLYLKDLMSTKDAVEGLRAFMEKRQPIWKDA